MDAVQRRRFLFLFPAFRVLAAAGAPSVSVRGKLVTGPPPRISNVLMTGDEATRGVLSDPRLEGADFEVLGHAVDPTHFEVDKIHTRSLFVHKDGKRLMVTYWCDVCYIRTYTPGKCWCCQKDTDLDLRENLDGV